MVGMSAPPVRRRPLSPSSSPNLAPPPTRRRLFSTPLQPPPTCVPLPPRHTLSFKVNGSATSDPGVSLPPPPRRTLSFKIDNATTLNTRNARSFRPSPNPNPVASVEPVQMGAHLPLLLAVPSGGDQGHCEELPRVEEEALQDYCQQALLSDGLLRIDKWTYVIQDWNEQLGILEPARFHHVWALPTGETSISFVCDCSNRHPAGCIHIHLFKAHARRILQIEPFSSTPHPPAFLVTHSSILGSFIFSVCSTRGAGLWGGKRTIVSLSRDGRWSCRSCPSRGQCHHEAFAVEYASRAGITNEQGVLDPDLATDTPDIGSDGSSPVPFVKSPISHLPIPPPRWCHLSTDVLSYPSPPSPISPQLVLPLDPQSRCCCGSVKPESVDTTMQPFVVFGVRMTISCEIEVAACTVCRHRLRRYGPDCGSMGVFNWNNRYRFTHELLNEYTSLFTSTVVLFSAFVTSRHRAYTDSSSPLPFCSTETFTRVWFAFTELQALDSGMQCISCGKHPEIVIADGVSIAYSSSKFVQGLLPPSATSATSPINHTVTPGSSDSRKAIPDRKLRKEVQGLVSSLPRPTHVSLSSDHIPELSSLVSYYLHLPAKSRLCAAVRELMLQISADDIVLQLVPSPSLTLLADFVIRRKPPPHLQIWIPAIGNVLNELPVDSAIPQALLDIASWLCRRAHQVFVRLSQHTPPTPDPLFVPRSEDYLVTGVCYGSPAIRVRPRYVHLPNDTALEDKLQNLTEHKTGDTVCGKYYDTYKKPGLVGGLMVLWCRHSVCVGFHIIPTCEGRNDVFSALYTHWPAAPKVVIYDFACQLAPYCLLREPQFFRNTRFLVDQFHASGHTKCSKASSSTYAMQFDPNLQVINTSAAEVGNSGAAKIRKSVSYMTQRHAIQYTKVYMDVINRCKIRKMIQMGIV